MGSASPRCSSENKPSCSSNVGPSSGQTVCRQSDAHRACFAIRGHTGPGNGGIANHEFAQVRGFNRITYTGPGWRYFSFLSWVLAGPCRCLSLQPRPIIPVGQQIPHKTGNALPHEPFPRRGELLPIRSWAPFSSTGRRSCWSPHGFCLTLQEGITNPKGDRSLPSTNFPHAAQASSLTFVRFRPPGTHLTVLSMKPTTLPCPPGIVSLFRRINVAVPFLLENL